MQSLTNTKQANLTVLGTHRRSHQICIGAYDDGTGLAWDKSWLLATVKHSYSFVCIETNTTARPRLLVELITYRIQLSINNSHGEALITPVYALQRHVITWLRYARRQTTVIGWNGHGYRRRHLDDSLLVCLEAATDLTNPPRAISLPMLSAFNSTL